MGKYRFDISEAGNLRAFQSALLTYCPYLLGKAKAGNLRAFQSIAAIQSALTKKPGDYPPQIY